MLMRTIISDNKDVLLVLSGIKTSLHTQTLHLCWSAKRREDGLVDVDLRYKKPTTKKELNFLHKLFDKLYAKSSFIYEEVENLKYEETLSGNIVLDLVEDNHYLLSIEDNGKSEVLGNIMNKTKQYQNLMMLLNILVLSNNK